MRAITFLRTLGAEELLRYHQVVAHSELVKSHFDVLLWLQGEMQVFLPHDIMIAAWGNFHNGNVQHDIISAIDGVRSHASNPVSLTPLLTNLFERWSSLGKVPLAINAGESGFLLEDTGLQCALGDALHTMRSAIVHGICDERGSHDCLYVTFSTQERADASMRGAMAVVLPFIDLALRQVAHLPHQTTSPLNAVAPEAVVSVPDEYSLSEREEQIMHWVSLGKTNPEIGSILDISAFTVKNHLQRIFKKLNVSNRAQAVSRFNAISSNA
jgi:transcriptional regulator EpsA